MQSGQGQAYEGLSSPQLVDTFKSKFQVTTEPSTSPYDIQFNTKIPPFNNKDARLAIYYATDTALLDQKLFANQYPVGQSFTAPAGLFVVVMPTTSLHAPGGAGALVTVASDDAVCTSEGSSSFSTHFALT